MARVVAVFDLDAYLARIGLSGRPGLRELHLAHSTSIPFESLDPQMGLAVSLAREDIFDKLVSSRRGGYCFEHNLLLAAALEELGAEVELYLARVLFAAAPGVLRPRSHLVLKVDLDGESWHADVGFGGRPMFEPLPWGPGEEHLQAGWRYQIVERQPEYVLQAFEEGAWADAYAFLPHPVPMVDAETSNWWTATNPSSRFVTGFLVSRQWPDGRRLAMSNWGELCLTERTPDSVISTPVTPAQVPALLAERFELPGFRLAADGRLAREPDAAR